MRRILLVLIAIMVLSPVTRADDTFPPVDSDTLCPDAYGAASPVDPSPWMKLILSDTISEDRTPTKMRWRANTRTTVSSPRG